MNKPLEELCRLSHRDVSPFGEHSKFNVGDSLPHGVETLIAQYDAAHPDGQAVDVYVVALPATFYKIEAQEGVNSIGEEIQGFTLSTGSGQANLAATIADAISQCMLGLKS